MRARRAPDDNEFLANGSMVPSKLQSNAPRARRGVQPCGAAKLACVACYPGRAPTSRTRECARPEALCARRGDVFAASHVKRIAVPPPGREHDGVVLRNAVDARAAGPHRAVLSSLDPVYPLNTPDPRDARDQGPRGEEGRLGPQDAARLAPALRRRAAERRRQPPRPQRNVRPRPAPGGRELHRGRGPGRRLRARRRGARRANRRGPEDAAFDVSRVLIDAYVSMQRTAGARRARGGADAANTQRLHSITSSTAIALATPPLDIGCAGTAASPPDVDRAATPAATSLA